MASSGGGDSALLTLVDQADDELMTTSNNPFAASEDTFVDMDNDTDQLLGGGGGTEESSGDNNKKDGLLSFGFYSKLFDVDTDDILGRLAWSSLPRPGFTSNFARNKIRAKPDLYGPFWICVTLVFSVAIAGNVSSYFQSGIINNSPTAGAADMTTPKHWHYDFHKVTLSATIVFLYAILMPSGLYAALWSSTPNDSPVKPSFIELACIFGYSLSPFVPASVLWLIQISMVQWIFVLVSFGLSGGVLALALWPTINEYVQAKPKSMAFLATVLALHLLLASGFMLCFFHVPATSSLTAAPGLNTSVNSTVAQAVTNAIPEKSKAAADEAKNHEGKRETMKGIPPTIPEKDPPNDPPKDPPTEPKKMIPTKESKEDGSSGEPNQQDMDEEQAAHEATKQSIKKNLPDDAHPLVKEGSPKNA